MSAIITSSEERIPSIIIPTASRVTSEHALTRAPRKHSKQTPECVKLSRFDQVVMQQCSAFTETEAAHLSACAFCQRNLAFYEEATQEVMCEKAKGASPVPPEKPLVPKQVRIPKSNNARSNSPQKRAVPPRNVDLSGRCQELLVEAGICCNVNAKTGRPNRIRLHETFHELFTHHIDEINRLVAWGTRNFARHDTPPCSARDISLLTLYRTLLTAIITEIAYPYTLTRLPREANDITNDTVCRVLRRLENQADPETGPVNWSHVHDVIRYIQTVCNNATAARVNWLNKLPSLLATNEDSCYSAFKQ